MRATTASLLAVSEAAATAVRRAGTLAAVALLVGGCASAGKLLNKGADAEAGGKWYEAAMRYADALEEDPAMDAAPQRLMLAGDTAVRQGIRAAEGRTAAGDPVGGAESYLTLDRLLARSGEVGVQLPVPDGFAEDRRASYDGAISFLMDHGAAAGTAGKWEDARSAYVRARTDFDPSPAQTLESQGAEMRLLLTWASTEERADRYRSAYERAEEVFHVAPVTPDDVAGAATELKTRALAAGEKRTAILSIGFATDFTHHPGDADLLLGLNDVLAVRYWQSPPPFIHILDPLTVREAVGPSGPSSDRFRRAQVDFGVLIEFFTFSEQRKDVKTRSVAATTRDGKETSYQVEEGKVEYVLRCRVTIYDGRASTIEHFMARGQTTRSFKHATYPGGPKALRLRNGDQIYFAPDIDKDADARSRRAVLQEAAQEIAQGAFERILRHIP